MQLSLPHSLKKLRPKRQYGVIVALSAVLLTTGGFVIALHSTAKQTPRNSTPAIHKTTLSKQTAKSATSQQSAASSSPSATPTPSAHAVAHTSSTPTPTPSACSKATYDAASASNTAAATQGLQQTVDPSQYYTVYGYTADQVRAEMNQCSPSVAGSGDFNAFTSWWLNFKFVLSTPDTNNFCTVQSAGVVVHVTSSYPQWSTSAYAAAGLSTEWQTFISNLTTHENGHRDLATQYASQLYNGLLSYPSTDCSTASQSVTSYGNSQITALNQAETNYDSQTNHGATQGATLY